MTSSTALAWTINSDGGKRKYLREKLAGELEHFAHRVSVIYKAENSNSVFIALNEDLAAWAALEFVAKLLKIGTSIVDIEQVTIEIDDPEVLA